MSQCHTRESIVGARKRPYFLTFSFIFARFGRFGCFACFSHFGGFVSLVSVVSFRPFHFVVSGFSTCPFPCGGIQHIRGMHSSIVSMIQLVLEFRFMCAIPHSRLNGQ